MQLDEDCLILAERLRVEERMILAACDAAGVSARLIQPDAFSYLLNEVDEPTGSVFIINRLPPTTASVAVTALAQMAGLRVINSPEISLLLANRVHALARLQSAGVPVLQWKIGWGTKAALDAIEEMGYPVQLAVPETSTPVMTVIDREAAEAIVEHRIVLGGDNLFIVQPYIPVEDTEQIHIAGDLTIPAEAANAAIGPNQLSIAFQLRALLGDGFYTVQIASGDSPDVTGIMALDRFRDLEGHSDEVARSIAGFAASQAEIAQ